MLKFEDLNADDRRGDLAIHNNNRFFLGFVRYSELTLLYAMIIILLQS